jgi:hypothetical protein
VSTVTLPRELAQSLLVLMIRDATDADVPAGQWLTFANALDKAMHAPQARQNAPGAMQAADPTQGACRFCRTAGGPGTRENGLCATCADDLLRDAQELERASKSCPRCDHA